MACFPPTQIDGMLGLAAPVACVWGDYTSRAARAPWDAMTYSTSTFLPGRGPPDGTGARNRPAVPGRCLCDVRARRPMVRARARSVRCPLRARESVDRGPQEGSSGRGARSEPVNPVPPPANRLRPGLRAEHRVRSGPEPRVRARFTGSEQTSALVGRESPVGARSTGSEQTRAAGTATDRAKDGLNAVNQPADLRGRSRRGARRIAHRARPGQPSGRRA